MAVPGLNLGRPPVDVNKLAWRAVHSAQATPRPLSAGKNTNRYAIDVAEITRLRNTDADSLYDRAYFETIKPSYRHQHQVHSGIAWLPWCYIPKIYLNHVWVTGLVICIGQAAIGHPQVTSVLRQDDHCRNLDMACATRPRTCACGVFGWPFLNIKTGNQSVFVTERVVIYVS